MNCEGLQSLFPMEDISVMGIFELLPYLNKIRIRLKETVEVARLFQPHVVVTIDSKGFSFRLLKQLKVRYSKEEHCPICVHYVAPSFWAWKGGERRLGKLSEFVDYLLCILPFEEEICRLNGLAASYVGHPLLEYAFQLNMEHGSTSCNGGFQGNGDAFRQQHGIPPGNTVITLLPGSRLQEVKRMLPIFSQTMELLNASFTGLSAIIPVAPHQHVASYIEQEICSSSLSAILIPGMSLQQRYDAFSASRAALCTSGSAVMELQLTGLPSVVAYRAHFLTEWLIQYRTKLRFISLPNILLDSEFIPEFLFHSCTYKNLATTLSKIILDEDARAKQIAAAEQILSLLCPQGLNSVTENCCPSMNAASIVLYGAKKD
ncbi:probable lipid-A-disaccharide synthase, mitochondrial isoform X2 [Phalaenopsis equestris]|nr:probable lipid-A-disaccharide synthase, mitochondrial isoform X2 [Phalaenopsis equestris]